MMFANHITGGIVFTGTFCSLFDVNVFDNPYSIGLVIVASVIPDIDHTKSIIGKMFYPISKTISIKFGHRTITHSLLFLFSSSLIIYLIDYFLFNNYTNTLIYFFAVLSHLLLDMVTVQGIPLFYPFARNPCVIPANPDLRIRSNNLKSEGITLFIFSCLTLFLQPLFANGFWTTYNNQFNTIRHVSREFTNSQNLLKIDYNYKYFNQEYKGIGLLLNADNTTLTLLNNNKITKIYNDPNISINKLIINKTDSILKIDSKIINNIELDSLSKILKDKFIIEGNVFSDNSIIHNGKKVNHIEYLKVYNYNLPTVIENDNKDKIKIENKIKSQNLKISKELNKKNIINNRILEINNILKTESNNYQIDKLGKELIELKNELNNFDIDYSEINNLRNELKTIKVSKTTTFNGKITYIDF